MERITSSPTVAEAAHPCPGCGSLMEGARCDHCGVTLRAGGYRILWVIAQGPHARIYVAEDEEGRRVALKELLFALLPSTEQLDAFEREASLLRNLRHPRIPRFVRGFTEGSGVHTRLYLAQEYVPGSSLAWELEQGAFSEEEVRGIAEEFLEVLDYLHGLSPKVLHRDIKPANIVRGADGRLVLVGTFGDMPPEQHGGTVDARSDLYALGATLLHLLSGKPPEAMMGEGLTLAFQRHVEVSETMQQFLQRMVAHKPEDRFASAAQARAFLRGGRVRPRLFRNLVGVGLSLGLALLIAGVALTRHVASGQRSAPPVEQPAESVSTVQPVSVSEPPLVGKEGSSPPFPPSTRIRFPWYMAQWELIRAERWVKDASGRDHHGRVSSEGVQKAFLGLKFLGTTGAVSVRDHPDFELRAPFTVMVHLKVDGFENERGIIIQRMEEGTGRKAFALEMRPNGKLRFSLWRTDGEVRTIEGPLPARGKTESLMIYATLDEGGEMLLYAGCDLLALGNLDGEPLVKLNPVRGAMVTLGGATGQSHGFQGELYSVSLMKGIMTMGTGDQCTFSLKKMPGETPSPPLPPNP